MGFGCVKASSWFALQERTSFWMRSSAGPTTPGQLALGCSEVSRIAPLQIKKSFIAYMRVTEYGMIDFSSLMIYQ